MWFSALIDIIWKSTLRACQHFPSLFMKWKKKQKYVYIKFKDPKPKIPAFVVTSIDSVAFLPPVFNDMPSFWLHLPGITVRTKNFKSLPQSGFCFRRRSCKTTRWGTAKVFSPRDAIREFSLLTQIYPFL